MSLDTASNTSDSPLVALTQAHVTPDQFRKMVTDQLRIYHPDRNPAFTFFSADAEKAGAANIPSVLGSLVKHKEIDRWDDPADRVNGRRIYFPKKGSMPESLVITARAPREFLALVDAYGKGEGLTGDILADCVQQAAARAQEAEDLDDQDKVEAEDYTEEIQDILSSLKEEASSLSGYKDWFESNQDEFHTELLSFPIETEAGWTNLRTMLNMFALDLIRTESLEVTLDSFDDFKDAVKSCRFFVSAKTPVPLEMRLDELGAILKEYVDPSRAEANRIVKEALMTAFERAIGRASREDLPRIRDRARQYEYKSMQGPIYLSKLDLAHLRILQKARKRDVVE